MYSMCKVSANFLKNINFEGPCDFLKMKTLSCRTNEERGAEIAFFLIELLKIYCTYSNRQKCVGFQKSKSAKSLHPTL